jgi:hypothetical protein
MNTIEIAQAHLHNCDNAIISRTEHGDGWDAIKVHRDAHTSAFRIFSNDVECELTIAEWKDGMDTGRRITVSASPYLIRGAIDLALGV